MTASYGLHAASVLRKYTPSKQQKALKLHERGTSARLHCYNVCFAAAPAGDSAFGATTIKEAVCAGLQSRLVKVHTTGIAAPTAMCQRHVTALDRLHRTTWCFATRRRRAAALSSRQQPQQHPHEPDVASALLLLLEAKTGWTRGGAVWSCGRLARHGPEEGAPHRPSNRMALNRGMEGRERLAA